MTREGIETRWRDPRNYKGFDLLLQGRSTSDRGKALQVDGVERQFRAPERNLDPVCLQFWQFLPQFERSVHA